MSRRYGRNQRRKAREEIARLEAVAADHWQKAQAYSREAAGLEGEMIEWAYRIVTVLGETSAYAREFAEVDVNAEEFRDYVNRYYPMRMEAVRWPRDPFSRGMVDTAARIVDTFAVYADSKADDLRFERLFSIRSRDRKRALMLDARTMHRLRLGKSHELARFLLEEMVKPWMEGRR